MAKDKNHTGHNQMHKNHRNGIKKPLRARNDSLKGGTGDTPGERPQYEAQRVLGSLSLRYCDFAYFIYLFPIPCLFHIHPNV